MTCLNMTGIHKATSVAPFWTKTCSELQGKGLTPCRVCLEGDSQESGIQNTEWVQIQEYQIIHLHGSVSGFHFLHDSESGFTH